MAYTLFFDTETNGYPGSNMKPWDQRIVELAAILCDEQGKELHCFDAIVDPGDYVDIHSDSAAIHGISYQLAREVGLPLTIVLAYFFNLCKNTDRFVAHNLDFDMRVVDGELSRLKKNKPWEGKPGFCTMKSCTDLVCLPPTGKMQAAGRNHHKSPKLEEAYEFFFKEPHKGAHNALADARACKRIFYHIQDEESFV